MNRFKFIILSFTMICVVNTPISASPFSEEACLYGDCSYQIKKLKELARYGSPDAQLMLGWMYLNGSYVEKNEKKAFDMFLKSSKNFPIIKYSFHQVGKMYLQGVGTKQDVKRGLKHLERAAEAGWKNSQLLVGVSYYDGKHRPIDYVKARKWLSLAADQGQPIAAFYASSLAEYGKGGPQDLKSAFKWLEMASSKGHEGAKAHLSSIADLVEKHVPLKSRDSSTAEVDSTKKNKNNYAESSKIKAILTDSTSTITARASKLSPNILNYFIFSIEEGHSFNRKKLRGGRRDKNYALKRRNREAIYQFLQRTK